MKGKDTCIGHLDKVEKEKLGFGGPQDGSGRKRRPKPSEISRQLMEENQLAVERPYWRALGFDVVIGENGPELKAMEGGGAKVVAKHQGETFVSNVDDLGAQMEAAERLKDRVYGKPIQATEISGPEGRPIEHEHNGIPDEDEFHEQTARVLAEAEAIKNDA